jgi:hypothetical protein
MNYEIENKQFLPHIRYALDILTQDIVSSATIYYGQNKPKDFTGVYIPESAFWRNYKKPESLPINIKVNPDIVNLYDQDIVAAAFFILTRYEETFSEIRDVYDRFPGDASIAHRFKFLHRPIVDEYRLYLFNLLKTKDPATTIRETKARFIYTHDLDKFSKPKKEAVITELKNLLRFRWSAVPGLWQLFYGPDNPADTFDWLNTLERGRGIYFLMNQSEDGQKIDSEFVQAKLKKLQKYGYQFGLHWNQESLECSPYNLNRNHFLRLEQDTWDHLVQMGIKTDFTLGYADQLGFRAGTCRPFKVFSLNQEKELDLTEYPLTIMDVTLYSYLRLSPGKAWKEFIYYLDTIIKYQGVFTLLWHNFSFDELRWRKFYQNMVNYVNHLEEKGQINVGY